MVIKNMKLHLTQYKTDVTFKKLPEAGNKFVLFLYSALFKALHCLRLEQPTLTKKVLRLLRSSNFLIARLLNLL